MVGAAGVVAAHVVGTAGEVSTGEVFVAVGVSDPSAVEKAFGVAGVEEDPVSSEFARHSATWRIMFITECRRGWR